MSKKEKVSYLRCSLPNCDNPLSGKKRKYCSRKCLIKANCLDRKDVYKELDSWGGPRSLSKVESSIKHDETLLTGDGRYILDDIPLDHQIWEAIEFQDELHRQACIEHENKVVVDGLEQFNKAYDKNHKTSYQRDRIKRMEKQGRVDIELRNIKQKRYYHRKKEERKAYYRKWYQENKSRFILVDGKRKRIMAPHKRKSYKRSPPKN